jgi:hypothetical protein
LCYVDHKLRLHGNQGDKAFLDRYIAILNDIIPAEEQRNIVEIAGQLKQFNRADLTALIEHFKKTENS